MSWIEVRFAAEAKDRAQLEIEHIMLVEGKVWLEFGPGAVGVGWDMTLVGLAKHLESGGEVDRQEAAAWVGSEDGERFMAASSERWRDASIAAGDDPDRGREAAQRTTSAYVGSPDA
jgi:hypothetical protein